MAPRVLLELVLKILGIFFFRDVLEALSRFFSVLVYLPQYETVREGWFNLGVTLPPVALYGLFCWILIFRTSKLIGLLRLDRNITQEATSLRIPRSVILSLAVIVIGVWMLANELPEFFRHLLYYYQERKMYVRMARPDVSYLFMSFLKVLVGSALILFNRKIAGWIEIKRRVETPWYWPLRVPFRRKKDKKVV